VGKENPDTEDDDTNNYDETNAPYFEPGGST